MSRYSVTDHVTGETRIVSASESFGAIDRARRDTGRYTVEEVPDGDRLTRAIDALRMQGYDVFRVSETEAQIADPDDELDPEPIQRDILSRFGCHAERRQDRIVVTE